MKKLAYANDRGSIYQIKEKTPLFNMARMISCALQDTDHYLVSWFLNKSAKSEFVLELK